MLILIVIDVQYSQKVIFSFENGSNRKNQSSSRCLHLVKKFPTSKISDSNLLLGCYLEKPELHVVLLWISSHEVLLIYAVSKYGF